MNYVYRFSVSGFSALTLLFLGIHFSPSDFGEYSKIIVMGSVPVLFIFGFLKKGFVRFASDSTCTQNAILSLVSALIGVLLLIAVCIRLAGYQYYSLVLFFAASVVSWEFMGDYLVITNRFKFFFLASLTRTMGLIFITILLNLNILDYVALAAASGLLISVASFFRFKIFTSLRFEFLDLYRNIIKFSAPLVVGSVGIYVVDNFAKWYFIYNDDIVSLGYYSFLYSVSQQVVGTIMFVLYSIELPNIVRAYDRELIDAISKHKRLLLSAYMIVLSGITMSYFFFEEIVYIAGLSNYSGYSFVSSVIAAAVWVGCFRSFYLDLYFMLTKSTKYVMYVSLIGGFVSVSVGFILIPEHNLNGAALTLLLVFMIMSASSYYLVRRLS